MTRALTATCALALAVLAGCSTTPPDGVSDKAPPDTITPYASTAPPEPPEQVAKDNRALTRAMLPVMDRVLASDPMRRIALRDMMADGSRMDPADAAPSLRAFVATPVFDDVVAACAEREVACRFVRREIDLDLHVGARLPAYCTAMGKAMLAFLRGEADVLVCTTIVESGLDIPSAHTLIVDAQLVGRWRRRLTRRRLAIEVELARPLAEAERAAVDDAVERHGLFVGLPATWSA